MSIALRNLLQDRTRLGLSIAGVALAVMLVLILSGFEQGFYDQITSCLDRAPGSVAVLQKGVTNSLGATSLLPTGAAEAVGQRDGVARVVPVLSQFVVLDLHGKKQAVYLVGYDPATGGGPWSLAEGREPQADDEAVLDRVLAGRHDLALGGRFDIFGHPFTIVGLSDGTTSWMTSFVFVRKPAVEAMVRAPGANSMLLVTPAAGVAPETLRDRLRDTPGTEVLLKREVIANDLKLLGRVLNAPIRLMVGISLVVGVLVVGLVIYTAT